MTDRINAFVVVLDKDIREDDAEALVNAMIMLKGVISVKGNVVDITDHIALTRARQQLGRELMDICYPQSGK
jgi:hypothetical protein